MLQEQSPAEADVRAPAARSHLSTLNTLVTALAVGLVVVLAVLVAIAVRFVIQDDDQTAPQAKYTPPATWTGAAVTQPAPQTTQPAAKPTPAVKPAAKPTPTPSPSAAPIPPDRPGQPTRIGEPATGAQFWAKMPLGDIHQDQGSSIALPGGRTLWIFADTFQLYNEPKFFITSSAAVTSRNSFRLLYSMNKDVPTEFLPRTAAERADRKGGEYYQAVWPTGSTELPDGRIIISYAKYRVLLKQHDFQFLGGGLFEYRYRSVGALTGGDHATRIANNLWKPADGEVRSPVYANGYVYFNQCGDLRCLSLRTTPDKLTDRDSYRWWTGTDWSSDRSLAQNIVVGSSHPGGNASVVRLRSGGYAMADTEVGVVSPTGLIWVAPNPWGPWSPAAEFDFPRCPAPGCYGLNIHPSLSTNDRLRISYATNGVGPFVRVVDVPVWISPDSSSILVR